MVAGFQEQYSHINAFYDIALEVIVIGLPRSDSKQGKGHAFPTSQCNSCQHHIVSRAYEIGGIVAVTGYYKVEIQLNINF